jgi:hypothetical protein
MLANGGICATVAAMNCRMYNYLALGTRLPRKEHFPKPAPFSPSQTAHLPSVKRLSAGQTPKFTNAYSLAAYDGRLYKQALQAAHLRQHGPRTHQD